MLFGTPEAFAVEVYHEPASPQHKGFGRMCLRAQGATLGNLAEKHCSLFHAIERISETADNLQALWDPRFEGHTDEEVFAWLDALLYGGEIEDEPDSAHRFDFLTNTGEQFDDSKSFILCGPDGMVRILFQSGDRTTKSWRLGAELYKGVAVQLKEWFVRETA